MAQISTDSTRPYLKRLFRQQVSNATNEAPVVFHNSLESLSDS
jgi:hypothetical protein